MGTPTSHDLMVQFLENIRIAKPDAEKYATSFAKRENGYVLVDDLKDVTEQRLESMGVDVGRHRDAILNAVKDKTVSEADRRHQSDLPIDYYRKLPKYSKISYNVPDLSDAHWPSICHSQYEKIKDLVRVNTRLVISGRRRIGKSYMITQIAQELWKDKESVFYIGLPRSTRENMDRDFLIQIEERLEVFDNSIVVPTPGMRGFFL